MKPSTPRAQQKLDLAMVHVENAQGELERACQDLSSLRGGAGLCAKAGKLRDACHSFFYALRDASHSHKGISVDSECEKCGEDLSLWRVGMPTHRCKPVRAVDRVQSP